MSHKLAKQERKAAQKVTASILINAYEDGRIDVKGLPSHYDIGMNIIGAAQRAAHGHYIKEALAGNMDAHGNVRKPLVQEATPEQIAELSKAGKA